MLNADIVVGWVVDETGELIVTDRHSLTSYAMPPLDAHNDAIAVRGSQTLGNTTVIFERFLTTEDENNEDVMLRNGTRYHLLWAYGEADGILDEDMTIAPHGAMNKGFISDVDLFSGDYSDMKVGGDGLGNDLQRVRRIHGSLMVTAWACFGSLTVWSARWVTLLVFLTSFQDTPKSSFS